MSRRSLELIPLLVVEVIVGCDRVTKTKVSLVIRAEPSVHCQLNANNIDTSAGSIAKTPTKPSRLDETHQQYP